MDTIANRRFVPYSEVSCNSGASGIFSVTHGTA